MIRTCWSVFKYSETSHQSLAVEAGKASCRITMITTTEMVAIKMANIATITAAVCTRVCVCMVFCCGVLGFDCSQLAALGCPEFGSDPLGENHLSGLVHEVHELHLDRKPM